MSIVRTVLNSVLVHPVLSCNVLSSLLLTVSGGMVVLDVLSVVSYFNGGLQLFCFCRGSQASCASCGLVSPKGV